MEHREEINQATRHLYGLLVQVSPDSVAGNFALGKMVGWAEAIVVMKGGSADDREAVNDVLTTIRNGGDPTQ